MYRRSDPLPRGVAGLRAESLSEAGWAPVHDPCSPIKSATTSSLQQTVGEAVLSLPDCRIGDRCVDVICPRPYRRALFGPTLSVICCSDVEGCPQLIDWRAGRKPSRRIDLNGSFSPISVPYINAVEAVSTASKTLRAPCRPVDGKIYTELPTTLTRPASRPLSKPHTAAGTTGITDLIVVAVQWHCNRHLVQGLRRRECLTTLPESILAPRADCYRPTAATTKDGSGARRRHNRCKSSSRSVTGSDRSCDRSGTDLGGFLTTTPRSPSQGGDDYIVAHWVGWASGNYSTTGARMLMLLGCCKQPTSLRVGILPFSVEDTSEREVSIRYARELLGSGADYQPAISGYMACGRGCRVDLVNN